MRNIHCEVAGTAHHRDAVDAVLAQFAIPGHTRCLSLEPQADNPADPDAVKVMCNGRHVGYIPARLAKGVRVILADGALRSVTVDGHGRNKAGIGWLRLHIQYVAPTKKGSAALLTQYSEELAGAVDGTDLQAVASRAYGRRAEMTRADKVTLKGLYNRAVTARIARMA